jgi:hypothetical protein
MACCSYGQDNQPHLLLTPRRLHRMKLDSQRQAERWVNFEKRVKTVPDSPERGFELALYAQVTGNQNACRQAVEWGVGHVSERRQTALIADWCRAGISNSEMQQLTASPNRAGGGKPFEAARDSLFIQIARGEASRDSIRQQWSHLLPPIQRDPRVCLPGLYALFEFIDAADKNFRLDLRQDDARLFANLPYVFLLAMRPGQLEQPGWKTRAAGLMMVNVDPNLQASTFVQGWALEDPKMEREGPGVAYEFLWANPYLPGLGYYNMDPWVYDQPSGLLLARKSWDASSCWVQIFHDKADTFQCAPQVLDGAAVFGKLTLQPVKDECTEIKPQVNRTTILRGLHPGTTIAWEEQGKKFSGSADQSGLFLLSAMASGKACLAERNK